MIKGNPEAERFLADYQAGRGTKTWLAYTGTLGLATIVAGIIASPRLSNTRVGQKNIRYAFTGAGASIILGSYIWGQLAINRNVYHLKQAIDSYNGSAPKDKKITWGVDLAPGSSQITTEVKL